jgi:hypothetical protein
MTLDSIKPLFIDFKIDKNNEYLNETFEKILKKKYTSYHEDIYNFCVNHEKTKPNNVELAKYIWDRMDEDTKIPKYIRDYFNNIQNDFKNAKEKKLSKEYLKEILERIRNKEICMSELGIDLKIAIDEYIYNKREEIINEYADL